jgi:hypothetical protein
MTDGKEAAAPSRKSGTTRAERLAAALKENLKKRKEQARARRAAGSALPPGGEKPKS